MKFPNFILIGAGKGGTSSFYYYLRQHPEIFMSDIKEPRFFFYNDMSGAEAVVKLDPNEPDWGKYGNWRPVSRLDDYMSLFAHMPAGVKAAGEASTAYLKNPFCAERIAKFNPAMKIIAILREPVSRAFSHYLMYVRLGYEKDSFSSVVDRELSGNKSYLPQGRQYLQQGYYADSISEYQRVFGKKNIKIYLNEELKNHPQELFYDAFHFLGVDTSFRPDVREKFNVNENVSMRGTVQNFIYRAGNKSGISKLLPPFVQKKLRGELFLNDKLKAKLHELYRDDVIKLQSLAGKDLSHWLK
jgi:sulfotransferase family protein